MTEKPISFGILGCGMIAGFHADALSTLENAVLLGVADASQPMARQFAADRSITAYETPEAMLADRRIDAVCICTPSGFHAENALQALRVGKHVVLEKPMAFTKAQARELDRVAKENDRVLTVISQLRFSDDIRKVKALIAQNAFGRLVLCDLYMKYWRDPEYYAGSSWKGTRRFDGGGALINQGIHGVDILLYLAGDAKVVFAKNRTFFHKIEVEDQSIAMLEFENGAIGVIEATTCSCPGFERRLEITGTEGSVVLVENRIERLFLNEKEQAIEEKATLPGTASDPTAMSSQLHARQLANFIAAIQGSEALVMTAEEGSRAVALIEEIYDSPIKSDK